MPESTHRMFRPPAEHASLLLRVVDGCPHNACAFCAMYRGVNHRIHDPNEISEALREAAARYPQTRRVFLADGDALALPFTHLRWLLAQLRRTFPRLSRVNTYASGRALAALTDSELRALREAGLHTVYLGLESGCDAILRRMHKRDNADGMILGVRRAQNCGLFASVMVLIGLGGRPGSAEHVRETVKAVNAMQPRLLSCLRLIPIPGTPVASWISNGRFHPLGEEDAVRELRALLAGLRLRRTVFRADHASNLLPLAGRLPADSARLCAELDELLAAGVLDRGNPGNTPDHL